MDKKILREVLVGLSVDQKITVNFRGKLSDLTGEYNFHGTKRGRGKGGSLLAELTEVTENNEGVNSVKEVVVIGTPKNEDILNLVANGVVYGYENESDVPLIFETDAAAAAELKESFRVFFNDNACPKTVDVEAEVEALTGTFTVTAARQMRGRGGQVVLETAEGVELWSGRHSGVIRTFQVRTGD